MVHIVKLKLLKQCCPGGHGPNARLHYIFDATSQGEIPTAVPLHVQGHVVGRYAKRGREYLELDISVTEARDNRLLVQYKDTSVLSFRRQ